MDGNIISFKVLLDSSGKLVTEKSELELNKIKESIPKETYYTLQTILRTVNAEFNKLHNKIETELDARAYKD
jgi:hypothetical protein|tara:strand:+ start:388 stop:603 length:216 start_codon:yes stop_codon:yes gene_type:complete